MTAQDVFTMAYQGLAAQGFERSIDSVGCRYRSPDGLKCAIGHAMPDHKYIQDMDTYRWGALKVQDFTGLFEGVDGDFLIQLQGAHDASRTPEEMKFRLRYVAETYALEVPE